MTSEFRMRNGKLLTEAQANRRRFMQGLAATGGLAALTGSLPRLTSAQATPEATPVAAYDGPLATDQTIRLPGSEPLTMDPGSSHGDSELQYLFNMYDGLSGVDQKTGEVVPRVAEGWDINEDGSVYTFHIRQGVTWSDGTALNANDFFYSWRRILDPDTLSDYAPAMFAVLNAEAIFNGEAELDTLGIKVIDDYTFEVTLIGPLPYFPLQTATWTFFPVPKHVIDERGDDWLEPDGDTPVVSNGPYVMTEWSHDQTIVLERNDAYFGEAPTVTLVTYTIFGDDTSQSYIAFENNELDYAAPEGPDLDRALEAPADSQNVIEFALSNCFFVVCDCVTAPTDNQQFRQALYKSIDRDELANTVLRSQFLPAPTIMAPDIPGSNPNAGLPESIDEAKALVAESGIDPSSVDLKLTYISDTARFKTVAEYLQARWQDNLGIKVTLEPIENATYTDWRAARKTQEFGVYTGTWGSDFADASNWINQNFTSQADHYSNKWVDSAFDDLAAQAQINPNLEERNQQYQQLETMLVEAAPIIPMYRGEAFRIVKPYVKDIYFQPLLSVVHVRNIKIAEH